MIRIFFLFLLITSTVVTEQFSMMEKLAVEFRHDPLTFCWLDLDALPPRHAKLWQSQLQGPSSRTCSSPILWNAIWFLKCKHLLTVYPIAFAVALSYKGKKISILPTPTKVDMEAVQKWIIRLVGGEVSQTEVVPSLFDNI